MCTITKVKERNLEESLQDLQVFNLFNNFQSGFDSFNYIDKTAFNGPIADNVCKNSSQIMNGRKL